MAKTNVILKAISSLLILLAACNFSVTQASLAVKVNGENETTWTLCDATTSSRYWTKTFTGTAGFGNNTLAAWITDATTPEYNLNKLNSYKFVKNVSNTSFGTAVLNDFRISWNSDGAKKEMQVTVLPVDHNDSTSLAKLAGKRLIIGVHNYGNTTNFKDTAITSIILNTEAPEPISETALAVTTWHNGTKNAYMQQQLISFSHDINDVIIKDIKLLDARGTNTGVKLNVKGKTITGSADELLKLAPGTYNLNYTNMATGTKQTRKIKINYEGTGDVRANTDGYMVTTSVVRGASRRILDGIVTVNGKNSVSITIDSDTSDNHKYLHGRLFTVTNVNHKGKTYKINVTDGGEINTALTGTVDKDGKVTFTPKKDGTYTITYKDKETKKTPTAKKEKSSEATDTSTKTETLSNEPEENEKTTKLTQENDEIQSKKQTDENAGEPNPITDELTTTEDISGPSSTSTNTENVRNRPTNSATRTRISTNTNQTVQSPETTNVETVINNPHTMDTAPINEVISKILTNQQWIPDPIKEVLSKSPNELNYTNKAILTDAIYLASNGAYELQDKTQDSVFHIQKNSTNGNKSYYPLEAEQYKELVALEYKRTSQNKENVENGGEIITTPTTIEDLAKYSSSQTSADNNQYKGSSKSGETTETSDTDSSDATRDNSATGDNSRAANKEATSESNTQNNQTSHHRNNFSKTGDLHTSLTYLTTLITTGLGLYLIKLKKL